MKREESARTRQRILDLIQNLTASLEDYVPGDYLVLAFWSGRGAGSGPALLRVNPRPRAKADRELAARVAAWLEAPEVLATLDRWRDETETGRNPSAQPYVPDPHVEISDALTPGGLGQLLDLHDRLVNRRPGAALDGPSADRNGHDG